MSDLDTNLNVAPYNDDYDATKRYYRILFVPRVAVQVRELTQLQTIIQEQIRRFGNHVFKDGSIVDGCNINHIPNMQYVRLRNFYNTTNANNEFSTDSLQGFLAVSPTTGVRASVRLAKPGFELQYPTTNTLYVDYVKTGRDVSNNEVGVFGSGETIQIYSPTQGKFDDVLDSNKLYNTIDVYTANVAANQTSTGVTTAVSVGEGIVYQKGFFVNVQSHTITVRDYSTDVEDYLVGFDTIETVVTHLQDQTLIDPADTTNSTAPGAHRLKLVPTLVSVHKADLADDNDFFPIIEYNATAPVTQRTEPEYAALGDVFATRTFEGHGDFWIKPFVITTGSAANTAEVRYLVNPGTAYIKGNRVDLLATKAINTVRATTLAESQASITSMNYGSYVVVDELVGMFDCKSLNTVTIYGTAQNSISDKEGNGSAPSGTIVGTARVRAVVYETGAKGTPDGRYRLYLTDVVMNATKSFPTHAKSFYSASGAFGNAKADVVLENGVAVIKDSARSSLVFPTGIKGIRRLRDTNGVNDTQFYLRDTVSGTLQANGAVTFTLNTPHAGGAERFFVGSGELSSINELKIDVTLSAATWSANNPGTVAANGGTTAIVGTSTTFTTLYNAGDLVRFVNGANSEVKLVASVANNTYMTIDSALTAASFTATSIHQRYYPAGHVLDLGTEATVTALSNTQFSVSTGTVLSGTPLTVYATFPVMRTQAVQAKKEVRKSRYVKINCATGGILGPWNLGLTDVYKINNVFVGPTYTTTSPERKEWFALDTGQTPGSYEHAKLVLNPKFAANITTASRLLVELSHFEASTTTGTGFFSVDSYPVRGPEEIANTTNISYSEIPIFQGVDLRNAIDFRLRRHNTANSAVAAVDATVNPAAANSSYVINASGTYIAEPDSNFQSDIEYYLPRIDLIQVNADGLFNVKPSIPSVNPKTPATDGDAMAIGIAYVPPFPSLSADEAHALNRTNDKISIRMSGNRVYTMKDIATLDQRLSIVEYYQTLSLLEGQAKDFAIRDENGLDRFKNGIFADPFKNHLLGNVSNFEYAIAIDEKQSIARPKVVVHPVDLKVTTKTNTVVNGQILSLTYGSKLHISQGYASKFRNATESVWNWAGNLNLYPSYDHYRDENQLPDINVVVDIASPWEDFAENIFGTTFGDWRTTSATNVTEIPNGSSTTTTTTSTRTATTMEVSSSASTFDLGNYVTDFSINPFIRSREVAFIATGLKPNSRFWVYFDKEPVSTNCAPATLNASFNAATGTITMESGNESSVVTRSAQWGTALVSDSAGNLYGLFKIPEGVFRVGDRELLIANVDSLVTGTDAITSASRASYTASSLTTTSRSASLTTIEPQLAARTTNDVRVETATIITQRPVVPVPETPPVVVPQPPVVTTPTPIPFPVQVGFEDGFRDSGGGGAGDPLGQSFFCETPSNVSGMFLDKIGVYFKAKDATLGITMVLTEMTAGFPDTSKIIGKSYLKPSQITTSDNSSVETIFNFNNIPYLSGNKFYSFFLQPDGDSPDYLVFMAEIGGTDILTGYKIFSNPNIGVAFTSSNSSSWTALQTEDVKFNVYRCQFNSSAGTALFVDQDDDYMTVDGFTLANSSFNVQVGDVVYTANSTGGVLTSNSSPRGVIQYVNSATNKLIIDSSTGNFVANTPLKIYRPAQASNVSSINANSLIASSTLVSVDDIDYSVVVPRIGTVMPFGTTIDVRFKGINNTNVDDPTWLDIQMENESEYVDQMRVVRSASNRVGAQSTQFQLYLRSNTDFLSPLVDMRRRSALFIENIINNDVDNEHTRYGDSLARYVSQDIILAEGQDAEDLTVLVTGHRPAGSDIHCYVKVRSGEDPDTFESKFWTKMDMSAGSLVYTNALDINDYREYQFSMPTTEAMQGTAYKDLANSGIVAYRNAAGAVFTGYKTFAIKLVLTSDRAERVPRMKDVRSIAHQI